MLTDSQLEQSDPRHTHRRVVVKMQSRLQSHLAASRLSKPTLWLAPPTHSIPPSSLPTLRALATVRAQPHMSTGEGVLH